MTAVMLVGWLCCAALGSEAQASIPVRVAVTHDGTPVPGAEVRGGTALAVSDGAGIATLMLAPGPTVIRVTAEGYAPVERRLSVEAATGEVRIALEPAVTSEESLTVAATRSATRVDDQPLRVEVVPGDEVQEKIMMAPGDVSMLLNETNGLRVQTTSPALGGATVRIQGLRGRYTQLLADGLPIHGGQTGAIGLLQIPPMDLGQVEVLKGVASALYGPSAIGGVVNLVSRRPPEERTEREILVNRTSHAGLDLVGWLAAPLSDRWGVTFVGGMHLQERSDLDEDGWTDLPRYRRAVVRPRVFWADARGRSLLVTLGGLVERRRGGTLPGRATPEGTPFEEAVDTGRVDGGGVWRAVTANGRVLAIRGSAIRQQHTHVFGPARERDTHLTGFGEFSLAGTDGRHTWVAGGALQQDRFRSRDVARFDYTHWVPGLFVQDELAVASWLTLSGSARLDRHSEYGLFASPRLAALVRAGEPWTIRVSAGAGTYAPTPFTEDTDAIGLLRVAPLGGLEPERARSLSADLTWRRAPLEVTATVFASRITDALALRETGRADLPVAIANVPGATRTRGTELIARFHRDELDVILTHMYLDASEPDPRGGARRPVPLNPRRSASLDILREIGPARIGIEIFYTGPQHVDENPYLTRSEGYVLYGGLLDLGLGRSRIFVNVENIGDVRQTRTHPLVRPHRDVDGRWTVDAWGPLDGRTLNAGVRFRF